MSGKRDFWSSRLGFMLATIGSAVGLGSIWKFPYEVGANGGGTFILLYLVGLGLIVFPLMLLEFAIGRRGRSDAIGSLATVAAASGGSRVWALAGVLGVITSVLILSYYSVIGGWALAYAIDATLNGLAAGGVGVAQARYDLLLASPWGMAAYHAAFMTATGIVVARGIAGGIEAASKVLMPALIGLIVMLAIFALVTGDVPAAVHFLFDIDVSRITAKSVLDALGLGFFSIGVGFAIMVTYAAYADQTISLRQVAIVGIVGDTAISLLAGLAVFPIVFSENLDPSAGPGLVFITLPLAFARIPFGGVMAIAFFLLLAIAALASAISLLEMPVALLRRWFDWSRPFCALISATGCWTLGLSTVLSFNLWAEWFPLARIPGLATATVYTLTDDLASNVLLPLGGLSLAVFGGWVLPSRVLADELCLSVAVAEGMRFLLRYLVPTALAVVALVPLVL
jgi:NSS family neurotransmitter:Na+ symporter